LLTIFRSSELHAILGEEHHGVELKYYFIILVVLEADVVLDSMIFACSIDFIEA
jgi:hypothetical protein